MQTPAQAQQTKFTTDFPIDKVVFKKAGSIVVPQAASAADAVLVTIPHGLPFAPLPIGSYSDDNYATSHDFGAGPFFYNTSFHQYGPRIFANIESDATNIYVIILNYDTTRTFRFRAVALVPPNIPDNTVAARVERADGLLFSSDSNYLKVFQEDVLVINDDGSFGDKTTTIYHNLGYIPTCLAFSEWGGRIRAVGSENSIGVSGIITTSKVDESSLSFTYDPFYAGILNLYYKVYIDG